MSRNTGTFNFAANFEGLLKGPTDGKQLVNSYSALTSPSTWNQSGNVWLYNGAIVAVANDVDPTKNSIYYLNDVNNYTMTCSWIKAGSGSSTLTGATNGLSLVNSGTAIALGGVLTENTYFSGYTLNYNEDYSGTYGLRSIPDVGYVNSIASGIVPKAAVLVATTTGITLSGLTTIDGVVLSSGNRVLVKNQASGATNGIYNVSTGVWTRSSDFDGSPSGETVSGSYMWVLSGNTNGNTAWVLNTPDPIIIGTTPLTFVLFAHVSDVVAGTGIDIQMSGGTHIISLNDYSQSVINNAITGATNGLTKVGTQVKLGGSITGNTSIQLQGNCLTLGQYTSFSPSIRIDDSASSICLSVGTGGNITLNNSTGIQVSAIQGIRYLGDYSANYVARSLVDAAYVTGLTSTSGVQTANNGLTKEGTNVRLGGTLTGHTCITINGNNGFEVSDVAYQHKILVTTGSSGILLGHYGAAIQLLGTSTTEQIFIGNDDVFICLDTGAASCISFAQPFIFCDSQGTKTGLKYAGDYSSNYTARSIPDVGYVTGFTSQGITGAINGLTKVGQLVKLGGTLTGGTCINMNNNAFYFNSPNFNSYVDIAVSDVFNQNVFQVLFDNTGNTESNWFTVLPTRSEIRYTWDASNCNLMCVDSSRTCFVNLNTGICKKVTFNSNAFNYAADYSSSFINRSLPDVAFVTGYTKSQSNIVAVREIILSAQGTCSEDEFVGVYNCNLITGFTVNLDNTPVYGQKVTIADTIGNALTYPICVYGQSYLINGCACAVINTDYGSVSFVFNCRDCWSAVSFIN